MKTFLLAAAFLFGVWRTADARTCICGATSDGVDVNVRTCASTSCSIIGLISPGQCADWVSTTGTTEVWHEIIFQGQNGWIRGDYVSGPQECGGGSYCTYHQLCSSFPTNQKRGCDSFGCGNYGAGRGDRPHLGWDVLCNGGATVYAPFAGTVVHEEKPYGDGSCCDTGFQIQGSGQFAGHNVTIFYARPSIIMPATVVAGQPVAIHTGLHCGCYNSEMTDHIHYHDIYGGTNVDPASWIFCN